MARSSDWGTTAAALGATSAVMPSGSAAPHSFPHTLKLSCRESKLRLEISIRLIWCSRQSGSPHESSGMCTKPLRLSSRRHRARKLTLLALTLRLKAIGGAPGALGLRRTPSRIASRSAAT